jgi:hypothetical protein
VDLLRLKKCYPGLLLFIPAFIAFFLALIPTLNNQWPLSWDIFYHVHLAKLYMENGIIFFDNLTSAPFGRPILYPPLFHFLLAGLSLILKIDIFRIARFLQPIFAALIVFSFSYVAYKLYDLFVGVSTGFFIFFSILLYKFTLPIPENMAMIFLPISVYFYYFSQENNNYRYSIFAGILLGLIMLTHLLSALMLLLIVLIYTFGLYIFKNKVKLKNLLLFLVIGLIIASLWWSIPLLNYGYVFHNPSTQYMFIYGYPQYFGVLTSIFAVLGIFLVLKKRRNKDILIFTWLIAIIALSNIYFIGISVLSERILTFALFPMVLLAGIGLNYIKFRINRKIFYPLILTIFLLAILSGFQTLVTAMPTATNSEIDVANWFKSHGDKETTVIASNYMLDPMIVSIARQPVSEGGFGTSMIKVLKSGKYIEGDFSRKDLVEDQIGYIVLTRDMKAPPYTKIVYKNNEYQILRFFYNN